MVFQGIQGLAVRTQAQAAHRDIPGFPANQVTQVTQEQAVPRGARVDTLGFLGSRALVADPGIPGTLALWDQPDRQVSVATADSRAFQAIQDSQVHLATLDFPVSLDTRASQASLVTVDSRGTQDFPAW